MIIANVYPGTWDFKERLFCDEEDNNDPISGGIVRVGGYCLEAITSAQLG